MLSAEEWLTFPGVIWVPAGEEPKEPTIPKEDIFGNPLKVKHGDTELRIRDAALSHNIYIQEVKIKKKRDKTAREDLRKDSEDAVARARRQVELEAEELRERFSRRREESRIFLPEKLKSRS